MSSLNSNLCSARLPDPATMMRLIRAEKARREAEAERAARRSGRRLCGCFERAGAGLKLHAGEHLELDRSWRAGVTILGPPDLATFFDILDY